MFHVDWGNLTISHRHQNIARGVGRHRPTQGIGTIKSWGQYYPQLLR